MLSQLSAFVRAAALTTAALGVGLSAAPSAHAQGTVEGTDPANYSRAASSNPSSSSVAGQQSNSNADGQWPGFSEVVCPGGFYGGAFHPFGCRAYAGAGYYGFFRRYWGYGFYGPNYNMGSDGSQNCGSNVMHYMATRSGHGVSKHGRMDCAAAVGDMNPSALPTDEQGRPPARKPSSSVTNAAHLQLLVPEDAEVLVDGSKTTATGTIRDFVSPPLTPGKNLSYTIVVRYTEAGKTIEESHVVRVRANDRLRLDCTKPANPKQTASSVKRS